MTDSLNCLMEKTREDAAMLKRIAAFEPDTKFPPDVDQAVPFLERRKWVKVVDSTDGYYVTLTPRGREILRLKARAGKE